MRSERKGENNSWGGQGATVSDFPLRLWEKRRKNGVEAYRRGGGQGWPSDQKD